MSIADCLFQRKKYLSLKIMEYTEFALQKGHGIWENPLVGIEQLTGRLGQEPLRFLFNKAM